MATGDANEERTRRTMEAMGRDIANLRDEMSVEFAVRGRRREREERMDGDDERGEEERPAAGGVGRGVQQRRLVLGATRVPDVSNYLPENLVAWVRVHPYACVDLDLMLPENMARAQAFLNGAQLLGAGDDGGPGELAATASQRGKAALAFEKAGLDPMLKSASEGTFGGAERRVMPLEKYALAMSRYCRVLREAVPGDGENLCARMTNHMAATMATASRLGPDWAVYDKRVRMVWGALGASLVPEPAQGGRDDAILRDIEAEEEGKRRYKQHPGRREREVADRGKRGAPPKEEASEGPRKKGKDEVGSASKRTSRICFGWQKKAGCKYGAECKFDHVCERCGKPGHGLVDCEEKD